MKTFLKLLVVAVIINGVYQVGMDEYRFSQLQDQTHSILALGTQTPLEELKTMVLKKAADLRLPVSEEKVTLSREGVRTSISVSPAAMRPAPAVTRSSLSAARATRSARHRAPRQSTADRRGGP